MTTNAGAAELAKPAIGFGRECPRGRRSGGDQPHVHAGVPQPARRHHRLRNAAAGGRSARVVDKFVLQLEAQLADRSVTIELERRAPAPGSPRRAIDPLYGARPLARVIQEYIKKPLAEELLFGKLEKAASCSRREGRQAQPSAIPTRSCAAGRAEAAGAGGRRKSAVPPPACIP